jgi:glycolate oxidase iron-sulfur subunit
METHLSESIRRTERGREAEHILRTCVHCGFCNATCPTYQIRGDELDGPRGRIYLIKQVLEGDDPGPTTQRHLDRCLTCLNCMTTCPSGVDYRHLLEIGRQEVETRVGRRPGPRLQRLLLRTVVPFRRRFSAALRLGRLFRAVLPAHLAEKIPRITPSTGEWPARSHGRRMVLPSGCVQGVLTPNVDLATARVLDRLGMSLERVDSGCCGALDHHLGAEEAARRQARRNIDLWWPRLEAGAEAILITASGCGLHVRDYGHLLRGDPAYAQKAAELAGRVRDPCELMTAEDIHKAGPSAGGRRIAFHPPCTLQHGLRLRENTEALLCAAGFELVPVRDSHLCCGSAGAYSILEPTLSNELRRRKVEALQQGRPEVIATANVGCQTHLAAGSNLPVMHWVELLDQLWSR